MLQELLYTSAPRGLKPGSRGFCTVASTQGMAANLVERLEGLSGYRHVFPPHDPQARANPVAWSHVTCNIGGRPLHILSRVADAGLDYSQRTNKLAHHLVLDAADLPPCGPAALLAEPGFLATQFAGEPRILPAARAIPAVASAARPCAHWAELTGDAGWAGLLAASALPQVKPVLLLFQPGQNLLPLLCEALALLPPEQRWQVTFSTYFQQAPPGVQCHWKCVLSGSPEAVALRRHAALCWDLTRPLGPAEESPATAAARAGRMLAAPARVAHAQSLPGPAARGREAAVSPASPPDAPPDRPLALGPPRLPRARTPSLAASSRPRRHRQQTSAATVAILSVTLTLFVVGGAAGGYWWWSHRDAEDQPQAPTPVAQAPAGLIKGLEGDNAPEPQLPVGTATPSIPEPDVAPAVAPDADETNPAPGTAEESPVPASQTDNPDPSDDASVPEPGESAHAQTDSVSTEHTSDLPSRLAGPSLDDAFNSRVFYLKPDDATGVLLNSTKLATEALARADEWMIDIWPVDSEPIATPPRADNTYSATKHNAGNDMAYVSRWSLRLSFADTEVAALTVDPSGAKVTPTRHFTTDTTRGFMLRIRYGDKAELFSFRTGDPPPAATVYVDREPNPIIALPTVSSADQLRAIADLSVPDLPYFRRESSGRDAILAFGGFLEYRFTFRATFDESDDGAFERGSVHTPEFTRTCITPEFHAPKEVIEFDQYLQLETLCTKNEVMLMEQQRILDLVKSLRMRVATLINGGKVATGDAAQFQDVLNSIETDVSALSKVRETAVRLWVVADVPQCDETGAPMEVNPARWIVVTSVPDEPLPPGP